MYQVLAAMLSMPVYEISVLTMSLKGSVSRSAVCRKCHIDMVKKKKMKREDTSEINEREGSDFRETWRRAQRKRKTTNRKKPQNVRYK